MRLPMEHARAFDSHRAARLTDQTRVRWLSEFLAAALIAIAMALAWFA